MTPNAVNRAKTNARASIQRWFVDNEVNIATYSLSTIINECCKLPHVILLITNAPVFTRKGMGSEDYSHSKFVGFVIAEYASRYIVQRVVK